MQYKVYFSKKNKTMTVSFFLQGYWFCQVINDIGSPLHNDLMTFMSRYNNVADENITLKDGYIEITLPYNELYSDDNFLIYETNELMLEGFDGTMELEDGLYYMLEDILLDKDIDIIFNYINKNKYNLNKTIMSLLFSTSDIKILLGLNLLKNII